MSFRWYCKPPPPRLHLWLCSFSFYFGTAYLNNAAKNMGDILRYIINFDLENLVIYKCSHFSCGLQER